MSKRLNLVGQKYNRLLVIEFAFVRREKTYWKCLCDCGTEKIIAGCSLRSGRTKSCGCLNLEGNRMTHGMCGTKFYNTWLNMRQRCNNPKSTKYKIYGERGITVCDRWMKSFENFRDDMLSKYLIHSKKYGEKNTTLDREDNMGNYTPQNCRFATNKVQSENRRSNSLLTYQGKTMNITQWAKYLNISCSALSARILKGNWEIEKALTTPIRIGNYKRKS